MVRVNRQFADNSPFKKYKKEMRILTGGNNDSPHTHVLHQLYLVYGESRQNMGGYA